MANLAGYAKNNGYDVHCFTSERQKGTVGITSNSIPLHIVDDICSNNIFQSLISETTLGIGIGEAWRFDKETIDKFNGRLLDYMGIPLPHYRGGAHFSWMILMGCKDGGCYLETVDENTEQGVCDTGLVIKSKEYQFPDTVRIPQDYFDYAFIEDMGFFIEFFKEMKNGKEFEIRSINVKGGFKANE